MMDLKWNDEKKEIEVKAGFGDVYRYKLETQEGYRTIVSLMEKYYNHNSTEKEADSLTYWDNTIHELVQEYLMGHRIDWLMKPRSEKKKAPIGNWLKLIFDKTKKSITCKHCLTEEDYFTKSLGNLSDTETLKIVESFVFLTRKDFLMTKTSNEIIYTSIWKGLIPIDLEEGVKEFLEEKGVVFVEKTKNSHISIPEEVFTDWEVIIPLTWNCITENEFWSRLEDENGNALVLIFDKGPGYPYEGFVRFPD